MDKVSTVAQVGRRGDYVLTWAGNFGPVAMRFRTIHELGAALRVVGCDVLIVSPFEVRA